MTKKEKVLAALDKACTMNMLEEQTGVKSTTICRYISDWLKAGLVSFVYKKSCPVSHYKCGYYQRCEHITSLGTQIRLEL